MLATQSLMGGAPGAIKTLGMSAVGRMVKNQALALVVTLTITGLDNMKKTNHVASALWEPAHPCFGLASSMVAFSRLLKMEKMTSGKLQKKESSKE